MNIEGWNIYEGEAIGVRVVYRGIGKRCLRGIVFAHDLNSRPYPCGDGFKKTATIIKADPGQEYIDPVTWEQRITDEHTFFVNNSSGALISETDFDFLEASRGSN